jgi:methylthioribose-1-phosphate isomerase
MIRPIRWDGDALVLLDQRALPNEEIYLRLTSADEVIDAIRDLVVRGAPAIGVSAAMGLVLGAASLDRDPAEFRDRFAAVCERMRRARPTAVNLSWAVDRMAAVAGRHLDEGVDAARAALEEEALRIYDEDLEANRSIGRHGAALLSDGATVLTHCNAGALATAGYGTALGVVRGAVEQGKRVAVLAGETRPFLQGARLTTWELQRDGIPCTLITDGMVGRMMQDDRVDAVIVGADRIAANGDVANKIGTYTVAVVADRHGIPFYVAAPTSTIDLSAPSGEAIPIEERAAHEVTHVGDRQIAPEGTDAAYPAFDITPHELVAAIVTEEGVVRDPYEETLAAACGRSAARRGVR